MHQLCVFQAQIYNKGGRVTTLRVAKRYYTDKNVQCRNCSKNGHLSTNCPEPKVSSTAAQQHVQLIHAHEYQYVKLLCVCVCVCGAEVGALLPLWQPRPRVQWMSQQALQQLRPAGTPLQFVQ